MNFDSESNPILNFRIISIMDNQNKNDETEKSKQGKNLSISYTQTLITESREAVDSSEHS